MVGYVPKFKCVKRENKYNEFYLPTRCELKTAVFHYFDYINKEIIYVARNARAFFLSFKVNDTIC